MPVVVVASEEVTSGKPLVFAVPAPAINGSLQKGSHQIQLPASEAIDTLVCCKSYYHNIYNVVLTVNAKLAIDLHLMRAVVSNFSFHSPTKYEYSKNKDSS